MAPTLVFSCAMRPLLCGRYDKIQRVRTMDLFTIPQKFPLCGIVAPSQELAHRTMRTPHIARDQGGTGHMSVSDESVDRTQEVSESGTLFAQFQRADPAYSPVPLWWWSGERLDPARLRWQLERYVEGGVFNLVVMNLAPTGPLYGKHADDPPYMSEAWWKIFRGVCADARELGVRIWFYDQIGFSGANFQGQVIGSHPEFAGVTIERISQIVEGRASLDCPPNGHPLHASVTALDAENIPLGPPVAVPISDDAVLWVGTGRVRLSLFYTAPRGFDYFSPAACARLLDTIHGEFERRAGEYFGDVIVGSFEDELPNLPRWSATFAATFQSLHGYDLIPLLGSLWEENGGQERTVRRDYHATRAVLDEEAFFKPLFAWHDRRGLLCGVDQQGPAREGQPQATVSIYADYLRTHRWYGAPGSDHDGDSKLHSSLAHLYGRERVWFEAFHSSGWGGTIEETFDWLIRWLRAGANLYDPHATYYSTRGGWFEWAPPATDWRQPYWTHYRVFADAIARLCQLLSSGRHLCDVGVLFPTTTVQSGVGLDGAVSFEAERAQAAYLALVGRMHWSHQETGLLDALGIDYDVLDDDSLASGKVEHAGVHIAGERYRTIVLPACSTIARNVAIALTRFIEAGGEVVALGALPDRLVESNEDAGNIIARLRGLLVESSLDDLTGALNASIPLVASPVPTLVRMVEAATVVFVPAAFPGASLVSRDGTHLVDFDRNRYPEVLTITVRDVEGPPEIWDPFTGTRQTATEGSWRSVAHGVDVDVPFGDAPCAVLVWDAPEATASSVDLGSRERTLLELDETWEVELIPTLDNRWGDFTFPSSTDPFPVQRWAFEHRMDGQDIGWSDVVATFASRAWWTGPGHPQALIAGAAGAEWRTADWSLSRGIHKDPIHRSTLGSSGHVPEEFMQFGQVSAGRAVRMRTTLIVETSAPIEGWLVVGAAAQKRIWIDSAEIEVSREENARYQSSAPVSLLPGSHTLDLMLTAETAGVLRASFAVTTDMARFRRPERLTAAGDPIPETTLRFESWVNTTSKVTSAAIQVGANAPCRIMVDDVEVGRQGGFMPYGDYTSTHPYDIAALLSPGDHLIAIEMDDIGRPASMLVDGVIVTATGEQVVMTDASWTVTRDGMPTPLAIERRQVGDPAVSYLRQRPHPLPETRWLEGPAGDDGSVQAVIPAAVSTSAIEWLRCIVPPGAVSVDLPLMGSASASLDGRTVGRVREARGEMWRLDLPEPGKVRRELSLRVETAPGYAGGAILTGPARFQCGPGQMETGDWQELGLEGYSGIVRYRQRVDLPAVPAGERIVLDLSDVRGTVNVVANGRDVGTRVLAPYRFDLSDAVGEEMTVEIDVFVANTLGPYLDAISPTYHVYDGQTVSGVFGPVRMIATGTR